MLNSIPCQIGEERATAIALMRKFIAYQFTDTVSFAGPLVQVFSLQVPIHQSRLTDLLFPGA